MRIWVYLIRAVLFGVIISYMYISYIISSVIESWFKNYYTVPMIIVPPPMRAHHKAGPKTIVWYDSYHNGHGLRNSVANAKFDQCQGSAKNCVILPHILVNKTANIVINADAVIFQGAHVNGVPVPRRKNPNQVFVLAVRENLVNNYENMLSDMNLFAFKDVFNWTMTYRHDSDILFPYGEVKPILGTVDRVDLRQIFENKKSDVVWFVSHCITPSKRENFVKELQKYITVHIYGKCGNFTCSRKKRQRDPFNDCLENAIRDYKFVLSFENSYIPNYVTEKFFDWFPRNIVQVVRGGGGDYSAYGAPNGTVINADEFSSAKALGEFLKAVGSDATMYTQYLHNKQGYFSVSTNEKQTESYCKLCELLQKIHVHRQSYTNIWAWLDSDLFSQNFYDHHNVHDIDIYIYFFMVHLNISIFLLVYFLKKSTGRFLFHRNNSMSGR